MTGITDTLAARVVTLRHAQSGAWVLEAPHPLYPQIPQPYVLQNRHTFPSLRAAVRHCEASGYVVVMNRADNLRYLARAGRSLES